MSFNVFEDDAIMAEFDRISAEPIDNEPYSLVKNPVPVVESILDFNGHKIDTGSWCTGSGVDENKKKVGKAKTASDPKLAKAAPAKTGEKKDDGKLVENVDAKEKKDDGKVTEVKTNTEVKAEKSPEAGKGGKFDSAAKSAASSNQSGAQKNKKFEENAKLQKHIDLFKKGVRSLATDSKTAADAEKVLKKFDKISSYLKPRTESVDQTSKKLTESADGQVTNNFGLPEGINATIIDDVLCIDVPDPATFDARQIPEEFRERGDVLFGTSDDCKKVIQIGRKADQIGRIIGLAFDNVITAGEAKSQISQVIGGTVTECSEEPKKIKVTVPALNAAAKAFGVTDEEIAAHYDDASSSYVDASGKPFVGPVDGFFSFIDPEGTSRVIPHTEDGIKKAGQYIAYRIKN